jgi:hypothetical protein
MTISQSRFGGAAEVGRNHNRPEQPKDRNADKAIASAVMGSAGAGGLVAGKKKLGRYGKHSNKAAGAVGLAGLLGTIKYVRDAEKSRDTFGYKRPTAHGVKQAQANRRQEEVKQSAAEGDRYRRMNGM